MKSCSPQPHAFQSLLPGSRLITCNSPFSFHAQCDAGALAVHREIQLLAAPGAPILFGLARAIAAHQSGNLRTFSAPTVPIHQLHGLARAIAAHQATQPKTQ